MKVSIITATYNSAKTIKDCIKSINSQTYKNIEHIIIDGASTDETLNIIKGMPNRIKYIISEKDSGLYDAMNKGIERSTGDLIGILNSDDYYVNDLVIEKVVDGIHKSKTDIIFGNIAYVDPKKDDEIVRAWSSGPYEYNKFRKGWHPAHPSFFVKKKIFEKYDKYNLNYKLAADFELMLRYLEKYRISNSYIPESLINMRLGGVTNRSLSNIIKQNIECYRAFKKNGITVSVFYPFLRLIPKLKQFLRKT